MRPLARIAWEETKNVLRQALFLPLCAVCSARLARRGERLLCPACRAGLRREQGNSCRICGKFLAGRSRICGECAVRPPPFHRHASYASYEEPLRRLIHQYKYAGRENLKHLFASMLLELHAALPTAADLVLPVPADPRRHRDFQPVPELARLLARKLELPYSGRVLRKVRPTPAQAGLDKRSRRRNLRGAFRVAAGARLRRRTVLLVDDVYTTGTTLRACAAQLRRSGCRVLAVTLAQSRRGDMF